MNEMYRSSSGSAAARLSFEQRVVGPVLDTDDPAGLASFYHRLLGRPTVAQEGPRPGYPDTDGWAKLRAPDATM